MLVMEVFNLEVQVEKSILSTKETQFSKLIQNTSRSKKKLQQEGPKHQRIETEA